MWYLIILVHTTLVAGWVDTFPDRDTCRARIQEIRLHQNKEAKTSEGLTYKDFLFLCEKRDAPPQVTFQLRGD